MRSLPRELSAGLSTLSTTVSLTRHRRNFNSIKSSQIPRDSDHGEYLFLPDDFGQRQPEPYSTGLFSSRPPFSVFRPERRKGGRGWNDNWRSWELSHYATGVRSHLTWIWDVFARGCLQSDDRACIIHGVCLPLPEQPIFLLYRMNSSAHNFLL